MIYIGTSGFSYQDWKGPFYPAKLTTSKFLEYYASVFKTCEINSSYYRIPTSKTTESMVKKTKGEMKFVFKVHQNITHHRNATEGEIAAFKDALKPLTEQQTLGALLVQFPFSFKKSQSNWDYICRIKEWFGLSLPLMLEVRNQSWHSESFMEQLRDMEFGFVNVDEPQLKGLMPVTSYVTNKIGYIRYHGRNKKDWYKQNGEPWERYNYLYAKSELQEWVPLVEQMKRQADTIYIFFNNHWQSQAVKNAFDMSEMLDVPLVDTGRLSNQPDLFG